MIVSSAAALALADLFTSYYSKYFVLMIDNDRKWI